MAELPKLWSRWGLITFAIAAPLLPILFHYGKDRYCMAAIVSVFAVSLVLQTRWKLHRHIWFWLALLIQAAILLLFVCVVPWPTRWIPGRAYIPVVLAEFYLGQVLVSAGDYFFNDEPSSED
jgi:cell division protein FtsW (lipid II flippase)